MQGAKGVEMLTHSLIILHRDAESPFAEKIRLILGFKGLR
jgi:hypothetical protein